jgi:predicted nucleic acid-binding protein
VSQFVVDASVAVKWYFQEEHATYARRLLGRTHVLVAPDLLLLEVCNAVWKRVRRGEITLLAGEALIGSLLSADVAITPSRDITAAALQLAVTTGRSAYDSTYLALALRDGCPLVTADRRLYDALSTGPYGPHLLWAENVP